MRNTLATSVLIIAAFIACAVYATNTEMIVDCTTTTLDTITAARTILLEELAAQNDAIDSAAASAYSTQLEVDSYRGLVAEQRDLLRTQNIALETLVNDYETVVEDYASKIVEYRTLYTVLQSVSFDESSSSANEKTGDTYAKKTMEKLQRLADRSGVTQRVLVKAGATATAATEVAGLDVSLSSNEHDLKDQIEDSALSSIDSYLGSSDLGSDSSVASSSSDSIEGIFKRLRNQVRADVLALKATHTTEQTAFLDSKAIIEAAIETAEANITSADASAASLEVTIAEYHQTIVTAIATATGYADDVADNLLEKLAYIRQCS